MRIDEMPLAEALTAYLEQRRRPFHMPGHKQGMGIPPELARMWGPEVFRYDLTELPGLDDLHAPQGAIRESQEAAARCFGAEESWFLVNGSTVGIQAAVMAAAGPDEPVLVPRQMHRSVLGGMVLSGARPVYCPVEVDACFGIPLAVPVDEAKAVLDGECRVKAMVEVHPNYYGVTGRLDQIAGLCREREIPLLVDEAHGAHFRFDAGLPGTALSQGADVAVQSWHKTLSSLTQTAVLHVKGRRVDRERLRRCLSLLQTTSPSYPLLLSLDAARWQMESEGQAIWSRVLELAEWIRERICSVPGLECLGPEIMENPVVGGWDPSKLLVKVTGRGMTGFAAARRLREKYGIEAEMADPQNVLFMLTPGDDWESARHLVQSLEGLAGDCPLVDRPNPWGGESYTRLFRLRPKVVLSPRTAFFQERRVVRLKEAVGEVCAGTLCPYPPGVPLLAPGEEVTREIVEMTTELRSWEIGWQGWTDREQDMIEVVK